MSASRRGILLERMETNEAAAAVHRIWDPVKFYERTGLGSGRTASGARTAATWDIARPLRNGTPAPRVWPVV